MPQGGCRGAAAVAAWGRDGATAGAGAGAAPAQPQCSSCAAPVQPLVPAKQRHPQRTRQESFCGHPVTPSGPEPVMGWAFRRLPGVSDLFFIF